jgi:hypothetical protein
MGEAEGVRGAQLADRLRLQYGPFPILTLKGESASVWASE